MTAALRHLAYGYTPDTLDEYLQMSQRVGRESLHNFCKCIIEYANVYLREPTMHNIHGLYEGHDRIHGFSGMLGSMDFDGIYPTWAAFVKGFSSAIDDKCSYFTKKQASALKDVERTFRILQGRWHILQQPARSYKVNLMRQLMYTCIVIPNITIEDNGYNLAENDWVVEPVQHIQHTWIDRCDARARRTRELRDREVHKGLQSDLVEHL
ncbi:uncharacterized protein [Rutidosis leptorrhynchoides]|uniref:uncharacterized protein n=1 Tax=Rutidosis leptorrhynchoides TaxID=125765 RepID=UPI003A99A380